MRLRLFRWRAARARGDERTTTDLAAGADAKWSAVFESADQGAPARIRTWLEIPVVHDRYERRITGGAAASWVQYCLDVLCARVPGTHHMVSLGCGTGGLERHLASNPRFGSCDAIDISASAVEIAQRHAAAAGLGPIHYRAADLNLIDLPEATYDAAWFNMSLHHVTELERLLDEVASSLRRGGLLFVHEYVGANRFDFPPAQKELLRLANRLMPEEFRRVGPDVIRKDAPIPDPVAVMADDPSEAVRSADIEAVLQRRFNVLERHEGGGTLLQYALSDVAWNFQRGLPGTQAVLDMLFAIEDAHLAAGTVTSDFVLIVAEVRT